MNANRRQSFFGGKGKTVTIHLNSKEDLVLQCTTKDKIEDIFGMVSKEKGIKVTTDSHKLMQKNGIEANITYNVTEDLELTLQPPYDPKEIINNHIFGKPLQEASKRGIKGLPVVLSCCFKYLQTEIGKKNIKKRQRTKQ
jgi:hypothetical protein